MSGTGFGGGKTMRIEWLNKKGGRRLVVFYNGWGMDGRAVCHLKAEEDVLMCFDYRSLEDMVFPDLSAYTEIRVIAWSMGVWAAANTESRLQVRPQEFIALNGTEFPVDDLLGIPLRPYRLTEDGLDEKGRDKFFARMFSRKEEYIRFEEHMPCRDLSGQREELSAIRRQSTVLKNEIHWNKIYISGQDVIFPVANLQRWAEKKETPIRFIPDGHYPFCRFCRWEEI